MIRFASAAAPLALLTLTLAGVGQEKKAQEFSSAIYPLKVGHRWTYSGIDPKEKVMIRADRKEPIKRRVKTDALDRTELLESYVLKSTSGDKSMAEQVFVAQDGVYRFASAGKEMTPPLRILKFPAVAGDSWPIESLSDTVKIRGAFELRKDRMMVLGEMRDVWVSSTRDFVIDEQPFQLAYWFAEGIGMVKQHLKYGKHELRLELDKFEPAGDAAFAPPPPKLAPPPTLPPPPNLNLPTPPKIQLPAVPLPELPKN